MEFANPQYLYLLLIIPLLIALYQYGCYMRKKKIMRYGDPELVRQLIPSHSGLRSGIVFWLSLLAAAMIILALARPRYGKGKTTITTKGVELVVALDVSNSMLANDIKPNRLEEAKRLIKHIAGELRGNKFALVLFAGESYVQLPITDDFVSTEMFIDNVSTKLVETQGTDIAAAINKASMCFTQNDKIGKAIVVITDGEGHEGGAEEAARKAAESGKKVFILGIGTAEGSLIELEKNVFLRDKDGQPVKTRLNEEMAMRIAEEGKGIYLHVDNTRKAQKILSEQLSKMNQEETKTDIYSGYEELFVYPIVFAFILLLLDIAILAYIDVQKRKNL